MENSQTLKSGTCPKCGANEVYTTSGGPKRGERVSLAVTSFGFYLLDTYLCMNCGHIEEYISDEDLKDDKMTQKVKENLKKVNPSG